ncbi:MAG: hypothetical protein LUQ50_15610 [Methanospirillum sp.]|uniref:hypothetical protein n=1 Tax=Methanospirillum sp. TaxID=45200 RepID=UPI00236BCE92|nr:hypothetical protein [Methanospirillum sp.]MDD1730481.1 hypothetical protein [Methanospirillum sp.]
MGLSIHTYECFRSICKILDGDGFRVVDLPGNKTLISGLKKTSYIKKTPGEGAKTDYQLTSEGKRYAKLQGWI